ncbi:hypothetical protein OG370_33140 [Streptomyces sp. NBC_00448]
MAPPRSRCIKAGHGSLKAVLLGLSGHSPHTVDVETTDDEVARIRAERRLTDRFRMGLAPDDLG